MRQWRLLGDPPTPGPMNMAIDEAILRTVAAGNQPPTLRLYAWKPFCLSLGYGQRSHDVDLQRLQQHGWDIVRRPTGGKAIFHAQELTYSVALPESNPLARGGILETYLALSAALMRAMQALGLGVEARDGVAPSKDTGPVCFEVPSKYEITIGGKKLIGSAQMRRHGGVLQHGSIPIAGDIAQICDVLTYATEAERVQARKQVTTRAATLADAGIHVSWDELAAAVRDGFATALGIVLVDGALSNAEQELAQQLYIERYAHDDWTHKR